MRLFGDRLFGLELDMYKFFWPVILVLSVFFFSLKVLVLPKIDEITELNKKVSKMKKNTFELDEKLSFLEMFDKEDLEKRLYLLNVALPKSKNVYYLVNVIDNIAREYNFNTDSFSVSPGDVSVEDDIDDEKDDGAKKDKDKDGSGLVDIPISVVLYGSKDRYLDLLIGIENSLPILVINHFEMETKGNVAKIDLNVSTFSVDKKEYKTTSFVLKDLKLSESEEELFDKLEQFRELDLVLNGEDGGLEKRGYVKYEGRDPFRQ